jgi:hypothetical protein
LFCLFLFLFLFLILFCRTDILPPDATSCYIGFLNIGSTGSVNIIGNPEVEIGNLYRGDYGLLSFSQTTPGQVTTVILPESTGTAPIQFNGDYNVFAGNNTTNYLDEQPYVISGIDVVCFISFFCKTYCIKSGNVIIHGIQIQVCNDFQFVAGLTLILPPGGVLYVKNYSLSISGFVWNPNSTVRIYLF